MCRIALSFLLLATVADTALAENEIQNIPVISVTEFSNQAPAYLSNGMIGVRPGPNPLSPAVATVSGYVGDYHSEPFEAFAQAPSPFAADIRVGEFEMLQMPEKVSIQRQSLDMSSGELRTEMTFQPREDIQLKIEILQFLSRSTPCLAVQRIKITPATDFDFEISSRAGESVRERTQLGIATRESKPKRFTGRKNQTETFDIIVAMVSERYHPEPQLQAIRMVGWGNLLGFETLRSLNRDAWRELWHSRVKIFGDPDAQRAMDVAFYYLHSSAHRSCKTGIAPFGFSQVEDYSGHVFWDMDHWIFHVLLPTDPDAAKAVVEFRAKGLPAARDAARLFGFSGAQYPWEASNSGYEVTPTSAPTGWAEQQVTLGVGLAAWEAIAALDDEEFTRDTAWPILRDVAKWIESRGQWTDRGFEITHIMGADENQEGAPNNSHTNLLCKMVMRRAVQAGVKLGECTPSTWNRIADRMVLPQDPETGIVLQHDNAIPEPGKELYAPGMLQLLVYHDPMQFGVLDRSVFKATYEFEEKLRLKLPPHPSNPLSVKSPGFTTPPFASCAAFFGNPEAAAEQFRHGWSGYWVEPYGMSKEYMHYSDGEYLMNHASQLQAVMYGFTGVRVTDGDWAVYPATLPKNWQRIEIDRMWIRGKPYRMVAEDGKLAQFTEVELDDQTD